MTKHYDNTYYDDPTPPRPNYTAAQVEKVTTDHPFNKPSVNDDSWTPPDPVAINYKFNEDKYIAEISAYIDKTYGQHYSRDKFQATEFIYDGGHGSGFNVGNVLKYAQRYGKKGTRDDARKDLMKVIHYAILQLHVHDTDV